ncbi:HAMP domain-containing histidine kinase [bacterium]|nr:HAMP domain-containing histidine kinase [bacterium]
MDSIEQNYEDFISTVSHELRTPLTSIRGFSQTMLTSWDKLDDDNKKKFIKIIEEQSNRLIHLVENMLSVTKLTSGNNRFVYNEISLNSLIDQTITIVKSQYPNQNFKFNSSKNPVNVFVDKDKFQQVLTNVIENSAKYSVGDNVTMVSTENQGNNVVIKISNSGLALNEKDYEKIFTKFARIDNPLTRKVQGSGLGLYITKNLVEKMGGKICVKSESVENSDYAKITFIITIPLKSIEEETRIKCNQ